MILEWFSRFLSKSKESQKDTTASDNTSQARTTEAVNEFFHRATNITIHGAHMFDHPQIFQTIQHTITTGAAALDRLFPYTCPDAAVDSSARDPPPRCHPGTRQRILNTLNHWLINHLWKIFWLSGPAGTGKSAVAQTFAEMCLERGRLGAAYFFFRSSGRNDPRTVIPSLAYQLAVNVPDYGTLLAYTIARDPSIFQKTPRVQLQRLIVEPFTHLQMQGHRITKTPLLIVLDGLDECKGIQSQCEFVEMIGEVVRLKKDLPLLWLISSRPEPHLKYLFSRADFSIDCSKEMLLIDADTRDDVDRYLRDSFNDMRTRFPLVADATWPSEIQSRRVEDIALGFFALAATIVRYISDITHGDPVGRLADFLLFMANRNRVATTNPLQTLDLLYSQILSEIPKNVLPTTKRILAFYYIVPVSRLSVQLCCNFLGMDKNEFYNALNKLHSLLDIPPPDKAADAGLSMYHASFGDYLRTRFRSGKFYIDARDVLIDCIKTCVFWYKTVMDDPRYISDESSWIVANPSALPGLKWISHDLDNGLQLSHYIKAITTAMGRWAFHALPLNDAEELLGHYADFDFRYLSLGKTDLAVFSKFAEWLSSFGSRNTLLRTEPRDELEETFLNKVVREMKRPMEPAIFPMVEMKSSESPYRYAFIGHGARTCLFWFNEARVVSGRCRLSCKALLREKYTISDCVIHEW